MPIKAQVLLISLLLTFGTISDISPAPVEPFPGSAKGYVLNHLATHNIVFMGTTHKQPHILGFIAELLPSLSPNGVTHLAMEISVDQQNRIDRFMQTGTGLAALDLHAAIDCIQYRELFMILKALDCQQRPVIMAIDLPPALYGSGFTRDQWMAKKLSAIFSDQPEAKVLVILGTLHVLRKLHWKNPEVHHNSTLRTELEQMRPNLKMHTIVNIVRGRNNNCDFTRNLAPFSKPMALNVDERFAGWQLGLNRFIAVRPAHPHELTDGIIMY
jgi:hypothetical protein